MARIVVGADGSAGANAALQWATDEASLRACELEIVHGWLYAAYEVEYLQNAIGKGETEGQTILRKAEEFVLATAPEVKVSTSLVAAAPAEALIDASRDAEIVVVGSHGRSALGRALLGSVSTDVVHHAHCPVLVVRS